MFTRVLAPVDTHPDAAVSVTLAEHIARHTRADLILMRVITDAAPPDLSSQRDALSRMADDIEVRGGARPRIEVVTGRPEGRILEVAERASVDLIVLAPHARSGLDALRHRSVTTRLVSRTSIPLLVAPEHGEGGWHAADLLNAATSLVIVPVDGSALSERAISMGRRIAEMWRRPLLLLRALESIPLYGVGPETNRIERQLQEEDAQLAHTTMSSLRARVARQTDIAVEAMVKRGLAEHVISQAADAYPGSLIVMSTHGRGAAQRALLGSVALSVLRQAREPVLILPPVAAMQRAGLNTIAGELVGR